MATKRSRRHRLRHRLARRHLTDFGEMLDPLDRLDPLDPVAPFLDRRDPLDPLDPLDRLVLLERPARLDRLAE